jgi:selenide,water dikinase
MNPPSRRREVMRRSQLLGHCICDVLKPCPCDVLKQQDLCPCAGERPPPTVGAVRLTEHVRNAGCASKIGKLDLQEILSGLPETPDPRVLVGRAAGDDAAIVRLPSDGDTVLTVDVFTPPVDDPYTFGRIAAANSVSDIYAMGAKPQAALSIIGFPIHTLPGSAMREILRGGIDTLAEAGVPVVGGHSLNDAEVKCGFAVVGTCPRGAGVRNAGAKPGDVLTLTKPVGGGFIGFAHQLGRSRPEAVAAWTAAMCALNRAAGEEMTRHGATAATDVTGFGLLGHLANLVRDSRVELELEVDALPLFPQVRELARQEVWPGAVERNREAVAPAGFDLEALASAQRALLFGPETSGGMLVFLPAARVEAFRAALLARGVEAAVIGRVVAAHPSGRIRALTTRAAEWSPLPLAPLDSTPSASETAMPDPCCPAHASPPDDAGACCADPAAGAGTGLPASGSADALAAYLKAVNAPGALSARDKKLISTALSVLAKCGPCVQLNAKAAREAGASEAQIAEAVALGIAFGGAPAAMFYNRLGKGG